jgi:hypothetical protein
MGGWLTWSTCWGWGIALIACTIALHVSCIMLIALRLRDFRREASPEHPFLRTTAGAITVIVSVAWLLAALHAVECAMWAFVYLHLGAIGDPARAMLYSVDSFTTRGAAADLMLDRRWLMLGAIESINGVLLFGISTAFLFHVMRNGLPDLRPQE